MARVMVRMVVAMAAGDEAEPRTEKTVCARLVLVAVSVVVDTRQSMCMWLVELILS